MAEVRDATGWLPPVSDSPAITEAPTAAELAALRQLLAR
jgi:hypothetical protein